MNTRHQIPKALPVALLAAFLSATSAVHATTVENTLPVQLPDFQTPAQLAKWRAETTTKTVAKEAAKASSSAKTDSSTGFYTGKPYLAESGSYAFKYREYNPEMNRWTTVDPSGFPDGANALTYCKNMPVNGFDWQGLQYTVFGFVSGVTFTGSYSTDYISQASTTAGGSVGVNSSLNGSVTYTFVKGTGGSSSETTSALPTPSIPSNAVWGWLGSPVNTYVTTDPTYSGSLVPGPGLTQVQSWTATTTTTQGYYITIE